MVYPEGRLIAQNEICSLYKTWMFPCPDHLISGVAKNLDISKTVVGIRHIPQSGASGWFLFNEDNFDQGAFEPALSYEIPSELEKFLGLPPGFTFKLSGSDHEAIYEPGLMKPVVDYYILDEKLPIVSRFGWFLEDVFSLRFLQQSQEPFFLQPLRNDDIVKLNFTIITIGAEKEMKMNFEKMWVHVKGEENGLYKGILDNDAACTDELKTGMELWFSPYHVDEKLEKK
ncbi:hypothetical protein RCC89_17205 [Cytophagaceae bacterium ABcell3]|nr:hypothetical protein RCC89_17205 [Cytophagaceae bacterium ABcell3]